MTTAISVELPESTVRRLEAVSQRKNVSQNDLIVQGIESVLAEELDRKMILLSDKQFEEALTFIENPTPPDVQERLRKTLTTPFPWEKK